VPAFVKPCGSAIEGQAPAAVTVAGGGGGGGGGGAAGLLMVMLPPVPGDAISSAPQPVTRTAAAVAYTIPRKMACPTMGSYNAAATNQKESPPVDEASFRHHL
jgi:hypothetical protein